MRPKVKSCSQEPEAAHQLGYAALTVRRLFQVALWLGATLAAAQQIPKYIPLNDLGIGNYQPPSGGSFQGGLYENGTNVIPPDHLSAAPLSQIKPINGKIVFLSLGMSNAMDEWADFIAKYHGNAAINPAVVMVNGAQGGIGPCAFIMPTGQCGNSPNPYDVIKAQRLPPYTEDQVQVVWLKQADAMSAQLAWPPSLPVTDGVCSLPENPSIPNYNCADAYIYERYIGAMVRAAKVRYRNLKLIFLSSRSYGGYNQVSKQHEPYAYEEGFSVKWAIQAQVAQADRGGQADWLAGDLSYNVAPWLAWGPYIWDSGPVPRSDGLVWCNDGQDPIDSNGNPIHPPPPGSRCTGANAGLNDYQTDQVHPDTAGIDRRTTPLLWQFFSTAPASKPWFLAADQSPPSPPTTLKVTVR
jgi:hypothetical protein